MRDIQQWCYNGICLLCIDQSITTFDNFPPVYLHISNCMTYFGGYGNAESQCDREVIRCICIKLVMVKGPNLT